jgi:hypothetical protein
VVEKELFEAGPDDIGGEEDDDTDTEVGGWAGLSVWVGIERRIECY